MTSPTSATDPIDPHAAERARRWRLVLGNDAEQSAGVSLSGADAGMDRALERSTAPGSGGAWHGRATVAAGWKLRAIRRTLAGRHPRVFPLAGRARDAEGRARALDLKRMLLEPEMLAAVEPDVHLVATLLALKSVIPNKTADTARLVVRRVVEELERRLRNAIVRRCTGSLNRSARNRRPRAHRDRLAPHDPREPASTTSRVPHDHPRDAIGCGRKRSALREIVLCVDQSGSMATSVVYSSDLRRRARVAPGRRDALRGVRHRGRRPHRDADDPVELLFGTQLGGGTDINRALAYCQIARQRGRSETILVLISDLYEGGNDDEMLERAASLAASGVHVIGLLALDDTGAPAFDHANAAAFAGTLASRHSPARPTSSPISWRPPSAATISGSGRRRAGIAISEARHSEMDAGEGPRAGARPGVREGRPRSRGASEVDDVRRRVRPRTVPWYSGEPAREAARIPYLTRADTSEPAFKCCVPEPQVPL